MLFSVTGCNRKTQEEILPDGGVFSDVPGNNISFGSIEIPLENLTTPNQLTVDDSGIIYVGNIDSIYRIDKSNTPELLIDGLTNCVGLTAAGDILYVFDARLEDLYLLKYDFTGTLKDEQYISLNLSVSLLFKAVVFQNIPFACLQFDPASGDPPVLINLETKTVIVIEEARDYKWIDIQSDGRLIARQPDNFPGHIVLSVNTDGSVNKTIRNIQSPWVHVTDAVSGKEYSIGNQQINLINDTSSSFVAYNPNLFMSFRAVCVNGVFYFLFSENKTISVISIPETTQRHLRIYKRIYNEPEDLLRFIRTFEERHPDIKVEIVPAGIDDDIRILAGEMEIDLIYTSSRNTFYNAGVVRDLSMFPIIVHALRNPDLLDGIWELSLNPDGTIFGVPCAVGYLAYMINEDLFRQLDITSPSVDWTVDDFYKLAKHPLPDGIYLKAKNQAFIYMENGSTEPVQRLYVLGVPIFGAGLNSSNGFIPRFDTREMTGHIQKAKEIYESILYYDGDGHGEDVLLYLIGDHRYNFSSEDIYLQPVVPLPSDMYGNRPAHNWDFLSIYSNAKNPNEAALFIAEFLDEGWHRSNAQDLQLFSDTSRYEELREVKLHEQLSVTSIKNTVIYTQETELVMQRFYFNLEIKLFNGELTVRDFVRELQQGVEQALAG